MRSRNTGHIDPHAPVQPTVRAVCGLLVLMLVAGLAAYMAAGAGLL